MHKKLKEKISSPVISLGDDGQRLQWTGLLIAVVFIGLAVAASVFGGGFKRFSYAYLQNFCFFASISLGGLFFVAILYLTKGGWGVTLRRIAEIMAMLLLPMLVLFLPILIPVILGYSELYPWTSPTWYEIESYHGTEALAEMKSYYLNPSFFGIRQVVYFAVWILAAMFFMNGSLKQDVTGCKKISLARQAFSAPFMILFAATLVFCSFDWEMSLEPMWFSTIFPVYFFAGSFKAGLSMIVLIALLIQRSGRVTSEITVDNYHDMAKLMFAFVFFWGYIAFSQFLLIWYANVPEETFYYQMRFREAWLGVSVVLLFGNLLIPFLGLMARTVRRNKNFLLFAALYLLIMHWVDHWWLVSPSMSRGEEMYFPLVEILIGIGMSGFFVSAFCFFAGDRPLVPVKDPWLVEALNYHNP